MTEHASQKHLLDRILVLEDALEHLCESIVRDAGVHEDLHHAARETLVILHNPLGEREALECLGGVPHGRDLEPRGEPDQGRGAAASLRR
jgi:hypothetical protein